MKWFAKSMFVLQLMAPAPLNAKALVPPAGLWWGATPRQVEALFKKNYEFLGPAPGTHPIDNVVLEQRYRGKFWGLDADQIDPVFFLGKLFSLATTFRPSAQMPASRIWDVLVHKMKLAYGEPDKKIDPVKLVSLHALVQLLPDQASKDKMMALLKAAKSDPINGRYLLWDHQVQSGVWIPEAVWNFDNGAVAKVLMRASQPNEIGGRYLKPILVFNHYDLLK